MKLEEQERIAQKFVQARRAAQALVGYPGEAPIDLASGYAIQELAIRQWPDDVRGWKVGRIPEHLEDAMGCDRLAGPIFGNSICYASTSSPVDMAVFGGGFAAVEAEFVVVIARDAPAEKRSWSLVETQDMVGDLRIGIEIASSPLSTINELGPPVVVSDFGNNAGLLIGPSIAQWPNRELESLRCQTYVDTRLVGEGGAFRLTGGYLRSVQFLLELTAQRGRPLRAGDVIATGQTNGIHDVEPGQQSRIAFGDDGELSCTISAAVPESLHEAVP